MNSPASVRARLLNASNQSGEDFQAVLTRYAIERFLYRLGESSQKESFILKGAMLFVAWDGNLHRPTKDLDLLGFGAPTPGDVAMRIHEIATVPADDGIEFDSTSIVTEVIKEDAEYEGVRVKLLANLEHARIRLQVDIGFGDAIVPPPQPNSFPTILMGIPAPRLRMYPAETVIAEKVHAMVVLDIRNSRMKDFYDVWYLSKTKRFELRALRDAFTATFERRRTDLPTARPFALTESFLRDRTKAEQWEAFLRRLNLAGEPGLAEVGAMIATFLAPVLRKETPAALWPAGGPWQE